MIKLLILSDYFLPAYKAGGPVRSLANLVDSIKDDVNIDILTGDRDLGDVEGFSRIEKNVWLNKEGYRIIYLSPAKQQAKEFKMLISKGRYDAIYLNSLFSLNFTLLPLWLLKRQKLSQKVVLAPRGMLHKGALKKKKLKKDVFLKLSKALGLYNYVTWHATSEEEVENIKRHFGQGQPIKLLKNIPSLAIERIDRVKETSELRLLYYARISREKNLNEALVLLKEANVHNYSLNIYGPIEDDNYWKICSNLIDGIIQSKNNVQIEYKGSVEPNRIKEVFQNHHVLYSPSGSENFGHSIAEAMSSGMPAILSTNTPWRELKAQNAGFDIELNDLKSWEEAIIFFQKTNQSEYDIWSQGAHDYAHSRMIDPQTIKGYVEMFSKI